MAAKQKAQSGDLRGRVVTEFARRYGRAPTWIVRAPGRVNLIGDHTDYNDGFVLPMAIDRAVWIALGPSRDARVRVHSLDFEQSAEFEPATIPEQRSADDRGGWSEYVRGVAWALARADLPLEAWEGVAAGDVPLGAGLSSSAALELAAARAFASAGTLAWNPATMARLAQRAENGWVGVNCGIMDQLISAAGLAGHALLIDCRTLDTDPVPIPADVRVVVLDTATKRGLVDSAYNERRSQCEAVARFFGVPALRDVDATSFTARAHELEEMPRKRARHVLTENARTLAAARALNTGDVAEVGRLMNESHASLRDDFEVSRRELDVMVETATAHDGCHGARMTGAGFGGCAVALVATEAVDDFVRHVGPAYERVVGLRPAIYVCRASAGASVETALV